MKIFFLWFIFILTLVTFQVSFFDILFPWAILPVWVFSFVLIWSLFLPFPQVFFQVIPTAVLFDIFSFGVSGVFSLYAICLVYMTSFLSRRVSIEYNVIGIVFSLLFSFFALIGYQLFSFLFSVAGSSSMSFFFSFVFSRDVFFSWFLCVPIFFVVSWIHSRFDRYSTSLSQNEFSKIK